VFNDRCERKARRGFLLPSRYARELAFLLGLLTAGAFSAEPVPSPAVPPPPAAAPAQTGLARWFDPDTAPFLPIPEIDASPSSGLTLGLIAVVLSTNSDGQIDKILAPDIIRSQYFGWGARWRVFRYPSDDTRWSIIGGGKEYTEREFDAEYDAGLRRSDRWSWQIHAIYDRSGTGRFFGLGDHSQPADQTSYIDEQARMEATAGRNLTPVLQLSYMVRLDTVDIEHGVLPALPSIETLNPTLPGLGSTQELLQRVVASYDTRDSPTTPSHGTRIALFAGAAGLGGVGGARYSYVGADATRLQPVGFGTVIAAHAAVRYMPRDAGAPFWALSALGGDRDVLAEVQALRGFVDSRFIDRNAFAGSVEARIGALAFHLFATDLVFEPTPFVDFGKVFAQMSENPLSHPKVAGGFGLRMLAKPFVVGYVDIGFGSEGLVVFSGINYPF
jgi:hypothetical protein